MNIDWWLRLAPNVAFFLLAFDEGMHVLWARKRLTERLFHLVLMTCVVFLMALMGLAKLDTFAAGAYVFVTLSFAVARDRERHRALEDRLFVSPLGARFDRTVTWSLYGASCIMAGVLSWLIFAR